MNASPQPLDIMDIIHIIGIGGIGMSGIAEILHGMGYKVQGSDMAESANVKRLRALGISVFLQQDEAHIAHANVVAVSSAIAPTNPELVGARKKNIPVLSRAEILAALMHGKNTLTISGTHGKTTTTSLAAAILDAGGYKPTIINGGVMPAYGSNARFSDGAWMVVEADESDGTFVRLPSTMTIVTNIDAEHLSHYDGSYDKLKACFHDYITYIPAHGVSILCTDHAVVKAMAKTMTTPHILTCACDDADAHIRAANIRPSGAGQIFDVIMSPFAHIRAGKIEGCTLPMAGRHNVRNALGAIAAGLWLDTHPDDIMRALAEFGGVERRFTRVGAWRGAQIIDDYAHHPVEITASLESAYAVTKNKVIAVVQPHRYTRLRDLFDAFVEALSHADKVILLPVYAAGEEQIKGYDSAHLAEALCQRGRDVMLSEAAELPHKIASATQRGDIILCMGAGDISRMARDLAIQLNEGV